MVKLINTLKKQATRVLTHIPEKNLKFNVAPDLWNTFNHQIIVRMDTHDINVNCMNEKTFNALFPEVKLKWCPCELQNFAADVQVLGEFQLFLLFKGVKYMNTFIGSNPNDCPNLLKMLVEGENVSHFIPKSHGENESRNTTRT